MGTRIVAYNRAMPLTSPQATSVMVHDCCTEPAIYPHHITHTNTKNGTNHRGALAHPSSTKDLYLNWRCRCDARWE